MSDLISVIIPIYHVTKDKRFCDEVTAHIRAIADQTYPDKEIILVDNGNVSDGDYCDNIAAQIPCVRTLHYPENISVGEARQHGLDEVRGKYFLFVDADDELSSPDAIERMYDQLTSKGGDVLICDYYRRIEGELVEAHPHGYDAKTDVSSGDFRFTSFYSGGNLAYLWGKLYRTSYVKEHDVRVADIMHGEDKSFSMCLYASEPKYVFSNDRFYIYTANPMSESHVYRPDYRDNWIGASKHLDNYIAANSIDPAYRDLSAYAILFSVIFHAKQEYEHTRKLTDIVSCIRGYRADEYCIERIRSIRSLRYAKAIRSASYRIGVKGLSFLISAGFIHLTAIGLYILFSLGVDKKHSSTG